MGKIVSETAAHSRYLTVFDRVVEFDRRASYTSSDADPPSAVSTRVSYDVVGHPRNDFKFAVVFPFHSADATVTIVSEYCQGTNGRCVSLPTGGFDPTRHATLRDAAVAELAEEARLDGERVVECLVKGDDIGEANVESGGHPGFLESKWCANRFKPFLAVDATALSAADAATAHTRDAEEFSMTTERVSVERLRELMRGGDMMVPSIVTANLALEKLAKDGLL